MIIKKTYVCSNCNKEFPTQRECIIHESICVNKHAQYRRNVNAALEKVLDKYGTIISTYKIEVDEDIPGYENEIDLATEQGRESYKFAIEIVLSNGNKVMAYDGFVENLWPGNYLEEDDIYDSLVNAIEDSLSVSYEGIVSSSCEDWCLTYSIGSVDITDILKRLDGQKVRIEVIE